MSPAKILALADKLAAIARQEDARKLARAIRSTRDSHRDGFMSYGTMKSHVESLLGTARAEGLLDDVNALLGE